MSTNISSASVSEDSIAQLLAMIGQPARIRILFTIGAQSACVCHIEAVLGMRQASISQHLMILRKAGLVTAQREGRNIFYRLARPGVLDILRRAAEITGEDAGQLTRLADGPVSGCPCPHCNPEIAPELACYNPAPMS